MFRRKISSSLLLGLAFFILSIITPCVHNGYACLSNPCLHGICIDDLNSTYFCYCIDGYTGLECQTNWNDCWSGPCQNGGVCIDGIASFNCTCSPGFVGDLCEDDFNECESNPCSNNGTCVDGPNGYFCQCLPGYSGSNCEIDIAVCNSTGEARCENAGICIEGPGNQFSCKCQPGWEGFLCEIETNECMSAPCQNGAVCIDKLASYECACSFGYAGQNCEEIVKVCVNNPCKNGALCLMEDEGFPNCYCVPDFHGELCQYQYDECQLGPRCLNGGTCIDGIDNYACSCPPNLTGELCECLIISINNNDTLNCDYVSPSTTDNVSSLSATTTVKFETESIAITTNDVESTILTTTSMVPNTTVQNNTDTATVPSYATDSVTAKNESTSTLLPTSTTFLETTTISEDISSYIPAISSFSTQGINSDEFSTSETSFRSSSSVPSTEYVTNEIPELRSNTFSDLSTSLSTEAMLTETSPQTNVAYSDAITLAATEKMPQSSSAYTGTTEMLPEETTTEIDNTEVKVSSTTSISSEATTTTSSVTLLEKTLSTESIEWSSESYTVSAKNSFSTFSSPIITTMSDFFTTAVPVSSTFDSSIPPVSPKELFTTLIATLASEYTSTTSIFESTSEQTTESETESNRTFPISISTTGNNKISSIPSTASSLFFTEDPFRNYSDKSTFSTTFSNTITSSSEEPSISTLEVPTSTLIISDDCSLSNQNCLNGGTCVYNNNADQHKCICPFDAEGVLCEIKLGIKNAAFNGNSYLTHRLPDKQNISIEFESKTLSSNGLLFHVLYDKSYMALYVENGFLMFKFSCGYQTMLLSEVHVPINNGVPINIKASMNFTNDFKHCEAAIRINNTLTMSGDQMAKLSIFSVTDGYLYLGGYPNNLMLEENFQVEGFIGCMSNLKILEKKVYIYKDAEDGYEISECSSIACLSNPCRNGASCSSIEDNWKCHCRNGFLGKQCELSICDNNPCLYGGTCIPFSSSGYICLCPYGKHGHFCENNIKINEPYFSSTVRGLSSFLAYSLPEGIASKMEIKFRFTPTTMEQISLLLFIGQEGQHDIYSDHLAVSFVKGFIMLTWNMGSGPRRIFTAKPIDIGARDYLVEIGYENRNAWLFVENLGNVTGRSPGRSLQLDAIPLLYLGGHHSKNFSTLPHDLPYHTGFSGCIFDLKIKVGSVILSLQGNSNTIGRSVGQCGTTECFAQSCQNGGACLHHGSTFICLCQDKWYGPLCSSNISFCDSNVTMCSESSKCIPLLTNYECDCPFGQIGKYCEKQENISDISFTGVRSFLSTFPVKINSLKLNIELELRTLNDNGIIVFLGNFDSSFICLSIQSGLLELKLRSSNFRVNGPNNILTVRNSQLLLKGAWHKIQFGIFGRKVYLYVDHIISVGVMEHSFNLNLPVESIFFGGFPDMSVLPTSASSIPAIPFSGCLRHFSLNERKIMFSKENIMESRNVIDCDGTPCGGESCLNGGSCWLDSFMNPHCSCINPYYGPRCEFMPKCSTTYCKNGYCHNSTSSCLCNIGFQGGLCETKLEVKTPSFSGKSYLIIDKTVADKKRNTIDLELKKLYLNFATTAKDGLLIWSRRDKNFLGLGLENSLLKIVYSMDQLSEEKLEIIPYFKLSDGLWHRVELFLSPFLLVKIDNKTITGFSAEKVLNPVKTNGVFFLGGLPNNISFIGETNGMFFNNFEGCIEAFSTNSDKIVTNFKSFEGVDIQNCNIL